MSERDGFNIVRINIFKLFSLASVDFKGFFFLNKTEFDTENIQLIFFFHPQI